MPAKVVEITKPVKDLRIGDVFKRDGRCFMVHRKRKQPYDQHIISVGHRDGFLFPSDSEVTVLVVDRA